MVALGDRSGTRTDCAFNFGNAAGWGAVTHFNDDVPWGAMGFPSTNRWHHLVYTYDGNVAVRIYADGQLWYSDTLGGALATPTGKPIYVGCQNGIGQLFSGYINAVRVWGGVLTPSQVTSNFLAGPWTLPAASKAITFNSIANATLNPGVTLNVTNSATDPNLPPLPLTFGIVSAPTNATINPATGLFTWRPGVAQANTTNSITLVVTNNSSPALSATRSFIVTVNPVSLPNLSGMSIANGHFRFQVNGDTGPDYSVQISTNLASTNWLTVFTTNSPALPFYWMDSTVISAPASFYRVWIGP